MKRILSAVSLLLTLGFPVRLGAHEGHAHRVMGTVKVVDTVHMEIETKDGERVSVVLTSGTKYLQGKLPAKAAEVKVGNRVVVTLVEKDGKKTAQEVLLAPAEGAGSSSEAEPRKP
jgi:hypothetical protein